MPARLLDGKRVAASVLDQVRRRVRTRVAAGAAAPGLAVVLVGDDPASKLYVAAKRRDCERVGFVARDFDLPADVTQQTLIDLIDRLNADPTVHGILVQLPLPPALDATALIQRIEPWKDVDGFHPENMGRLALRQPGLRPCTPRGVMTLLAHTDRAVHGRHAVVVGASNHVGRPMLLELLLAGCTVTCCHRFTLDLERHVADADILVVAVGRAGIVPGEWVKPGAVVVDVGITRTEDGRLLGDVGHAAARERAAWITPVPGGVGPMTRAMLLLNTLEAAEMLAPAPAVPAADANPQPAAR